MIFTLVRIRGLEQEDGSYIYESLINQTDQSVLWINRFESEAEMIRTMNGILTRQRKDSDVLNVLDAIRKGEHQFYDLDLTEAEAASLGSKSHGQE